MYSPDGRQIAYTAYGYGSPQINLMYSDGSGQRSLTQDSFITNINPHPVWSADGQSVLFSDFANLDSLLSVPQNCTDPCNTATQTIFNNNGLPLMTTSFIPLDQSRLFMAAFERTKNGGYGVYGLDSQSTNKPERLTINAGLASPAMVAYQRWIAFVSGTTDFQQRVDDANLFILDTNCIGSAKGCSGTLQQIATQIRAEDNLSWSPDGHWLAYVTITGNTSQLTILDTTCIWEHLDCGNYTRHLPISSSRYIRPAWRPALQ
jgi:Tol biopolymer transport system component